MEIGTPDNRRRPERARWHPLLRIMAARLALLLIVMASLVAVVYEGREPPTPFYLFLGAAFLVTILYAIWLRSEKTAGESVPHQFAVDPLIVTGLVYFTGGIDSQLYLLYPLIVLAAGIAVSGTHALHVTLLSILVYSLLIILQVSNLLVHPLADPQTSYNLNQVAQVLLFRILIIAMVGGATSYFAKTVSNQERLLNRFNNLTGAILDSVAAPLLIVDHDQQIISANQATANLCGKTKDALDKIAFADLFVDGGPRLADPQDAKRLWSLRQPDSQPLPILYAASKCSLPVAELETTDAPPSPMLLVTLFDISRLANPASPPPGDNGQKRAAANVASEIAHVVRNPLTAIRGAGELLGSAVDHMFASEKKISEPDWQTIKSMCDLIFEQSVELDKQVGQFLTAVQNGETDLETTLAQADRWQSIIGPTSETPPRGPHPGC